MDLSVTSALVVVLITSTNVDKTVAVALARNVIFFILVGKHHRAGTLQKKIYKTAKF